MLGELATGGVYLLVSELGQVVRLVRGVQRAVLGAGRGLVRPQGIGEYSYPLSLTLLRLGRDCAEDAMERKEANGSLGDTLTLFLSGEVALSDLATAMTELRNLVTALTAKLAGGEQLDWIVDDLQSGSTSATVRGHGDSTAVGRIVYAYEEVGEALERAGRIPHGRRVANSARRITGLIDGRIRAVRFETAGRDFVISSPKPGKTREAPELEILAQTRIAVPIGESWGAVEGRIQTLSNRGGLRFTLYDQLFDRAVSCYLDPGYPPEEMRDRWGRRAMVEGWVKRDPISGRPETIRRIRSVVVLPDAAPRGFAFARGVLPFDPSRRPEDILREMRDAQ